MEIMNRTLYSIEELNAICESKISVYGAGDTARHVLKYLAANNIQSVDNIYVTKCIGNPRDVMGIPVTGILDAAQTENKLLLVCVTEQLQFEILESIRPYSFREVIFLSDVLIRKIIYLNADFNDKTFAEIQKIPSVLNYQTERILRFVTKPCLEYLIINILDHCNLRCKGCDHFACIADEKFYLRENIYRDLERMAEIFHGDYIMKIAVMGGEPLLHPELKQILADVRHFFPYAIIRLTTNGILLLQQDDEFWRVCRENNVTIVNTKYPLKLKFGEIQKKAKEEKVKFQFFEGTGGRTVKHSFKKIINLNGDSNPADSFSKCHISNYGNTLLEGKFYGCPFSIQSYRIFNKKFDQNLRMTEDDWIDIYKVNDKEEFFKFAARPKFYCRYCEGLSPEFPWERTKEDISEWVIKQ